MQVLWTCACANAFTSKAGKEGSWWRTSQSNRGCSHCRYRAHRWPSSCSQWSSFVGDFSENNFSVHLHRLVLGHESTARSNLTSDSWRIADRLFRGLPDCQHCREERAWKKWTLRLAWEKPIGEEKPKGRGLSSQASIACSHRRPREVIPYLTLVITRVSHVNKPGPGPHILLSEPRACAPPETLQAA